MIEQPALFEGYQIERQHAGLTFEIEAEDERFFRVDQPVVLVILAQVDVPRFGRTKDGGLKRFNKLIPVVARVADGVMRDEVVEMFSLIDPGAGLFYTPPAPRPDADIDIETGEIEPVVAAAPTAPPPAAPTRDPALAAFINEGVG